MMMTLMRFEKENGKRDGENIEVMPEISEEDETEIWDFGDCDNVRMAADYRHFFCL